MKTEIIKITPKLAAIYLKAKDNNRNISPRRVAYYADQMKRGVWELTGQGISFNECGQLIDGQHRLEAIIAAGTSVEMLVVSGISNTAVDVYDSGKSRSYGDVFAINEIPNSSQISSIIQAYFSIANAYSVRHNNNSKDLKFSPVDCLNIYHTDTEFWQNIAKKTISLYNHLRLFSPAKEGGYMAYLILYVGYDITFVTSFLEQVHGIKPDKFQYIKMLRQNIVKAALKGQPYSTAKKMEMLIDTFERYVKSEK